MQAKVANVLQTDFKNSKTPKKYRPTFNIVKHVNECSMQILQLIGDNWRTDVTAHLWHLLRELNLKNNSEYQMSSEHRSL